MSMTQPEFAHFVVSESENAVRSLKPPGLKLGNRDSTNQVLGTTPAPKGQSTTKLELSCC
jgi:hypothetical protein